jgi:hypothetical protein
MPTASGILAEKGLKMNGMLHSACVKNVCLSSVHKTPMGGRVGTLEMSPSDFCRKFGNPHVLRDVNILTHGKAKTYEDQKVSVEWCFDTPRGTAIVRDYWWNGPNEMSIQANNRKATLWIKYYLRSQGLTAI